MTYFLFALLWDIGATLHQSSCCKITVTFACGGLVLDLMISNLDLKNHNEMLTLPLIYLKLHRILDLDRTCEISQFITLFSSNLWLRRLRHGVW